MSTRNIVKSVILGAVVTLIFGMIFLLIYIASPSGSQSCGIPLPWIEIEEEWFGLNRGQTFHVLGFIIDTLFWAIPIYFLGEWYNKHKLKKMRKIIIYPLSK